MTAKESINKQTTAMPGFTTITPKAESDYDKMIRTKQESQREDSCPCCGGSQSRYDYKPGSVSKPADALAPKK